MIYAFEAEGSNTIKFGYSEAPRHDPTGFTRIRQRIRTLQTGCPHKIVLIAVVDWPYEYEQKIHEYLVDDHVQGGAEWFFMGPGTSQVLEWMKDTLGGPKQLSRALRERITP
jgi:hypothetical protein